MKPILLVLSIAVCALNVPAMAQSGEYVSEVIALKYASASKVADELNRLFPDLEGSGNGRTSNPESLGAIPHSGMPKIISDVRSNSLLIFATPSEMEKLRAAVAKLDVPVKQILIEMIILEQQSPTGPADLAARAGVRWATNFVGVAGTLDGFKDAAVLSNDLNSAMASLLHEGGTNIRVIQKPMVVTGDKEPVNISLYRPVVSPTPPMVHEPLENLRTSLDLSLTPVITADNQIVVDIATSTNKVTGKISPTTIRNAQNTTPTGSPVSAPVRAGESLMFGGAASPPELRVDRGPSELIVLLRASVVSDSAK